MKNLRPERHLLKNNQEARYPLRTTQKFLKQLRRMAIGNNRSINKEIHELLQKGIEVEKAKQKQEKNV